MQRPVVRTLEVVGIHSVGQQSAGHLWLLWVVLVLLGMIMVIVRMVTVEEVFGGSTRGVWLMGLQFHGRRHWSMRTVKKEQ